MVDISLDGEAWSDIEKIVDLPQFPHAPQILDKFRVFNGHGYMEKVPTGERDEASFEIETLHLSDDSTHLFLEDAHDNNRRVHIRLMKPNDKGKIFWIYISEFYELTKTESLYRTKMKFDIDGPIERF
jgi:hypothetical protein